MRRLEGNRSAALFVEELRGVFIEFREEHGAARAILCDIDELIALEEESSGDDLRSIRFDKDELAGIGRGRGSSGGACRSGGGRGSGGGRLLDNDDGLLGLLRLRGLILLRLGLDDNGRFAASAKDGEEAAVERPLKLCEAFGESDIGLGDRVNESLHAEIAGDGGEMSVIEAEAGSVIEELVKREAVGEEDAGSDLGNLRRAIHGS